MTDAGWLESLTAWVDAANGWVWGVPLIGAILATGVLLTVMLRFVHVFNLARARRQWAVKAYRLLYVLVVFVGPYLTVSVVWGAADVFNGLMAFPNLVALVLLSPVVVRTTRDYFRRTGALSERGS